MQDSKVSIKFYAGRQSGMVWSDSCFGQGHHMMLKLLFMSVQGLLLRQTAFDMHNTLVIIAEGSVGNAQS